MPVINFNVEKRIQQNLCYAGDKKETAQIPLRVKKFSYDRVQKLVCKSLRRFIGTVSL